MKLSYHNGHGEQLIMELTPREARDIIHSLHTAINKTTDTTISHYATHQITFENDNDKYVPTEFILLVEGDKFATEKVGCKQI